MEQGQHTPAQHAGTLVCPRRMLNASMDHLRPLVDGRYRLRAAHGSSRSVTLLARARGKNTA